MRGRTQFSVEKPNTVSQPMLRLTATRTIRAMFSSPSVCPAVRGWPRRSAQRPLPSMMQPTWSGRGPWAAGPAIGITDIGEIVGTVRLIRADTWENGCVGTPLAQSRLEHVMVVGGTPKEWDALTQPEWLGLASRLGEAAQAAGARWLTLRPYGPEPGDDGAGGRRVHWHTNTPGRTMAPDDAP